MRGLIFLAGMVSILSACKKEEEPTVVSPHNVFLESADLSGAKVLFHTFPEALYALNADNSISEVQLNYNTEQHTLYSEAKQIYPFDKDLFVISYDILERTYLVDKETGETLGIRHIPRLHYYQDAKVFALLGLGVYYIDETNNLYYLPNFSSMDTAVQQINPESEPATNLELGTDGTLVYKKHNDALEHVVLHPNGDKERIETGHKFWTDLNGIVHYMDYKGIHSISNGTIQQVYGESSNLTPIIGGVYNSYFGGGIYKDMDNHVLFGVSKSYYVDLTRDNNYLNIQDIIGYTGYTAVGYSDGLAYIFVTPVVEDEQWASRDLEAPSLLIVNTADMSYILYGLETDRVIEDVFYADNEIVTVQLGSTFPESQSSYEPNMALFDLTTLRISLETDLVVQGAIYYENIERFW